MEPKPKAGNMERGRRLAELRGSRTQKQIADAIGVKPQAVSNWERGTADVDRRHLAALDVALGAGGEVVDLYAPGASGVTLAELDAKLDEMFGELRDGQVKVMGHVGNEIARATEVVERALNALRRQVEALDPPRQRNARGAGSRR